MSNSTTPKASRIQKRKSEVYEMQDSVRGQLRNSWGLLFVGLKELINEVAAAIYPKSIGVTKALKSGASFARTHYEEAPAHFRGAMVTR